MEHIFNKHNIHILRQQILENQIVFTNGCFDLLHPGHIQYLDQAKKLGEILVVGLNSDQSVKRLKGPQRPINNQEFRATMLLGLKSVDYVIIFDEDTPIQTIQRLRPAIHVK
ncbi:MAG: adenylyltransferase/cytidyltransferase family protein, partial [Candidatus Margulisiibacteriota bacterium]